MNAVEKMNYPHESLRHNNPPLTLDPDLSPGEKRAAEKRIKAYLNEKLTYFYNNGGPIMDI